MFLILQQLLKPAAHIANEQVFIANFTTFTKQQHYCNCIQTVAIQNTAKHISTLY